MKDALQTNVEQMTMKNVQMHMLARNSAKLLQSCAPINYGRHLTYHKAYYATNLDETEHYFVEPYIQGVFDSTIFAVEIRT